MLSRWNNSSLSAAIGSHRSIRAINISLTLRPLDCPSTKASAPTTRTLYSRVKAVIPKPVLLNGLFMKMLVAFGRRRSVKVQVIPPTIPLFTKWVAPVVPRNRQCAPRSKASPNILWQQSNHALHSLMMTLYFTFATLLR